MEVISKVFCSSLIKKVETITKRGGRRDITRSLMSGRVVSCRDATKPSSLRYHIQEEQPLLPYLRYSAYIEATTTRRRRRLDQEGRRVEGIIPFTSLSIVKSAIVAPPETKARELEPRTFFFRRNASQKNSVLQGGEPGIRHHIRHSPATSSSSTTTSTHRTSSNQNHISSDLSDDTIINY